jgi:hypothetical protein
VSDLLKHDPFIPDELRLEESLQIVTVSATLFDLSVGEKIYVRQDVALEELDAVLRVAAGEVVAVGILK